jgi:hypothetical protein
MDFNNDSFMSFSKTQSGALVSLTPAFSFFADFLGTQNNFAAAASFQKSPPDFSII